VCALVFVRLQLQQRPVAKDKTGKTTASFSFIASAPILSSSWLVLSSSAHARTALIERRTPERLLRCLLLLCMSIEL